MMKACVLSTPSPVEKSPLLYRDVPKPQPLASEVLIHVKACGICRTDLHVVEGELPPRKRQIIPGHQVVGTIEALGERSALFPLGARVGIPWLHRTCGICRYCSRAAENLCESAEFTGYTANGGYAEYMVAPEEFAYALPDEVSDVQAAPLLCAGIIGFRSLRLSAVPNGGRLGIYGFGAAGHVAIQVAHIGECPSMFVRATPDIKNLRLNWVQPGSVRPPQSRR